METADVIERFANLKDVEVLIRGGDILSFFGIEAVLDAAGGIEGISGQEETPEAKILFVQWSDVVWVRGLPSPV